MSTRVAITPEELPVSELEVMDGDDLRAHVGMHIAYHGSTDYSLNISRRIAVRLGYPLASVVDAIWRAHIAEGETLRRGW